MDWLVGYPDTGIDVVRRVPSPNSKCKWTLRWNSNEILITDTGSSVVITTQYGSKELDYSELEALQVSIALMNSQDCDYSLPPIYKKEKGK